MTWTWCNRLLLVLSLLLFANCKSLEPYMISDEGGAVDYEGVAEETRTPAQEEPATQVSTQEQTNKEEKQSSPDTPRRETPFFESFARTPKEPPTALPADPPDFTPPQAPQMTNQELLDSALDFCQASNEFWERGDLDNAIDALDEAYSLILKVNRGNDPELLRQKEDLRFTISKRIIEVYSSRFTVANGYHKAIPLVMNKHVERELNLFKGRERRFFLESYRRSGRYRPAIAKALKEAGLPEELSWLPLIESGFKIRALSRARALGLWQFIASTGYKYGLKRNQWIDERMDPEKSTQAAIAYLKELHQIFGDWTTVLAAYNSGEWTVLHHIRGQRINYLDNFWDLYEKLPRETAFYVPRFLAVLHILNDPEANGFNLPPVDEEIKVEQVPINKQVHLKTVAQRLGIDYGLLGDLNPELRHSCTPNSPYSLKVPVGKGEILLAKLGEIPVWEPPEPAYVIHRVRYGESLSLIAERYRTSVRGIMAMNGLRNRNYVKVGWKLKIPTKKRYAYQTKRAPAQHLKPKGDHFEYVVRKGDSLWLIANRFNTTTESIRSLNNFKGSTLQIGQVLVLSPSQIDANPLDTKQYRVREGDSPYLIAKKYEMDLVDFLKLNKLTPRSTIFPGQIVQIKAD